MIIKLTEIERESCARGDQRSMTTLTLTLNGIKISQYTSVC